MQVTFSDHLEGGRGHVSIGRIKATACWRAAGATSREADRQAAVAALVKTAEDYEADAIIGVDFELDGSKACEIGGVALQRVIATGIAVKFAHAA